MQHDREGQHHHHEKTFRGPSPAEFLLGPGVVQYQIVSEKVQEDETNLSQVEALVHKVEPDGHEVLFDDEPVLPHVFEDQSQVVREQKQDRQVEETSQINVQVLGREEARSQFVGWVM